MIPSYIQKLDSFLLSVNFIDKIGWLIRLLHHLTVCEKERDYFTFPQDQTKPQNNAAAMISVPSVNKRCCTQWFAAAASALNSKLLKANLLF